MIWKEFENFCDSCYTIAVMEIAFVDLFWYYYDVIIPKIKEIIMIIKEKFSTCILCQNSRNIVVSVGMNIS